MQFHLPLKIILCQNLNNVFLRVHKLTDTWKILFPFFPNEILGRISFVIQGCNKTPMYTQIPICTSWVGLPNENSHSEQSGNSAAPSLTPLPDRALNSNKKQLLFHSNSVFIQCGVVKEGGGLGNYQQNLSKSTLRQQRNSNRDRAEQREILSRNIGGKKKIL